MANNLVEEELEMYADRLEDGDRTDIQFDESPKTNGLRRASKLLDSKR